MPALTETQVVTLTLWGEGRGEPIEGRIAIGCLIRNRVDAAYRGRSYREVCLSPWQFSCWQPQGGQANYEAVMQMAHHMETGEASDVLYEPVLRECGWIAHGIIGRWIRDTVKGAKHYHAAAMAQRPTWAIEQTPVAAVGAHLFYTGVA